MRVAYLIGSLNRGGAETLLLDIFKNNNIFECIGIYRKGGTLEKEFNSLNSKFIKISSKNIISYLLKLRKTLQREKINIVHAHQTIDALFSILINIFTSRKTLITIHGFDFKENILNKIILNLVFSFSHKVIFVSKFQSVYYKKKYKIRNTKIEVIYNGVDVSKFVNISNSTTIRDELNFGDNVKLLGFVGNFVPGRDHLTVCKMVNELKNENIHLLIIGQKSSKYPFIFEEVVNYLHNNQLDSKISLLGERNDVPSILKQLDYFIYATDHDTFGLAVIEAIISGVPVIANDWEVMKEISLDGRLFTLCVSKDYLDYKLKFDYLNKNHKFRQDKTLIAQKYAYEHYTIDVCVKNYYDLYLKLNY